MSQLSPHLKSVFPRCLVHDGVGLCARRCASWHRDVAIVFCPPPLPPPHTSTSIGVHRRQQILGSCSMRVLERSSSAPATKSYRRRHCLTLALFVNPFGTMCSLPYLLSRCVLLRSWPQSPAAGSSSARSHQQVRWLTQARTPSRHDVLLTRSRSGLAR